MMIAVIDMTGDGWGFVGKLHRMGYAVSWVVERDVGPAEHAYIHAYIHVVRAVECDVGPAKVFRPARGAREALLPALREP